MTGPLSPGPLWPACGAQSGLAGPDDGLRAVTHLELGEYIRHMVAHGLIRQMQTPINLADILRARTSTRKDIYLI